MRIVGIIFLLFVLGSHCLSQTVIGLQDFDGGTPVWGYTGGSAAAGSGLFPNTPNYVSATNAREVSNGTATILFNTINTAGYTSVNLSFRLASFAGTSGNGADGADEIMVEISTDAGATWSSELEVEGNSNAKWGFSGTDAGTGTASINYDGDNAATVFTPAGGGYRGADGYSFIEVNNLPATANLRVRIIMNNNSSSEYWIIDDVEIEAVTACTPATEPSSNASAYSFSAIACDQLTLSWTRPGGGSNDGCIVVVKAGSDVTTDPSDGTVYTANAAFGSGDDIGASEFVVYNGTGSSVTITGLAASTTYYFNVFEFNGTSTCIDYRTSDEVTDNEATIVCPAPAGTCADESFDGAGNSGSYSTINWTGDDGIDWTATDARGDQDLNASEAVMLRVGSLTNDASFPNGCGVLEFDYARIYSGNSTLKVFVNGVQQGADIAVTNTTSTHFSITVNVTGPIDIELRNAGTRTLIDNLEWTCYSVACTPASEPTSNASAYSFSSVTCNSITIDWTRPGGGSNDGCIVVVKASSDVTTDPSDGTNYTANTAFGSGDDIGASEFVVYNGTGTSVTITGLAASTTYYFNVFEFNGTSTCIDYRTNDEISGNEATIVCTTPPISGAEGILINEFSNGSSGNEEYYEFIVAGDCGSIVDISGYIIDDNNGDFSSGATAGTGIAEGHLRLKNVAQWTNIEVGSIIVVYNDSDPNSSLPADDIDDSDGDLLYVIPHNESSLFEITSDIPTNTPSHNPNYSPVTYVSASWDALSLANGGDAVQTRDPSGAYWHGISYGPADMSGGPDDLKVFAGSMGGMVGYFNDTDPFDVINWSTGAAPADETPGAANNAANAAFLALMRDPLAVNCPIVLPVELLNFDGERVNDNENLIFWNTATEINNRGFELLRSSDGLDYQIITFVQGAGNSQQNLAYTYNDKSPNPGENYYKLRQIDYDGRVKNYNPIMISNSSENLEVVRWNKSGNNLTLTIDGYTNIRPLEVKLIDVLGKTISIKSFDANNKLNFDVSSIQTGIYILQVAQEHKIVTEKIKL